MNSVIIFLPRAVTIEDVARELAAVGKVSRPAPGAVAVEAGHDRVRLDQADDIARYYDGSELGVVTQVLGEYTAFTAEYLDIGLVKQVIQVAANRWPSVIDDDHGTMLPGGQFLELLASRPDWDWRTGSPGTGPTGG